MNTRRLEKEIAQIAASHGCTLYGFADLESKIVTFIKYYNTYLAKPYQWTYTGKPLAAFRKVA